MEMYGDIKSVRMFDLVIYVLLKNKTNKSSNDGTLLLQIYKWKNNNNID